MSLQRGQTALVRIKAATAAGQVPREGYAVAEFWAPGRDPRGDPEARAHPDSTLECFWDAAHRAWTCQADTSGWAPGTWTVRGLASCPTGGGPAKGWCWLALELEP